MSSNSFFGFLKLFCFHPKKEKTSKKSSQIGKNEYEISHSLPFVSALISDPSVIILQKNIYKIILDVQPTFFSRAKQNQKKIYKKKQSLENIQKSKVTITNSKFSCLDFRCPEKNLDSSFPKKKFLDIKTLIKNAISDLRSNFTLIYNYSKDPILFSKLNSQVTLADFI